MMVRMRTLPNGQSLQYGREEWISIGGRCLWATLVEVIDDMPDLCFATDEGVCFTVHEANVTVLDATLVLEDGDAKITPSLTIGRLQRGRT